MMPTYSSRRPKVTANLGLNSRIAIARTATVMVWVPAFPPIEATIGISTASATIFSIVFSKNPITIEAATAVSRFTNSHGVRPRKVSSTEVRIDASDTPASAIKSSSASSSITSIISSSVIMPASLPSLSTTPVVTIP